jgi:hypothetical protein
MPVNLNMINVSLAVKNEMMIDGSIFIKLPKVRKVGELILSVRNHTKANPIRWEPSIENV